MIAVLTDPGVGGTFLTWSLYYLRGDDSYFCVEKNKQIKLPANPLTANNSHGFIPNQPNRGADRGLKKLVSMTNQLLSVNGDEIIYLHNFDTEKETKDGVEYLTSVANKIILLTGKNHPLYHCRYKKRSVVWISDDTCSADPDIIYNYVIQTYFAHNHNAFQAAGLTEVWDKREFIALNFNPHKPTELDEWFNCSVNHYVIDTFELFNFSDHVISIFNYLGLHIDNDRYTSWLAVYKSWQEFHKLNMMFSIYFNKIIDYTIKGYNLDLTRFDLDLMQEAAIQHELIYKHNLNLKTWHLEKFTNTAQLHQLLEPNTHDLSNSKIKNISSQ